MSHKTVLIVDDDADIRESLREAFEDEGYAVEVAADGKAALDRLETLPRPCVIILDIIMPVMSGTEFHAAMQADDRLANIPVLVTTSDPSRAPAGTLMLKKPVNLDRLLQTVSGMFPR